jgi:hypothetical protein
MYATIETYDQHDLHCPNYYSRENYEEQQPVKPRRKELMIDTPELRRKRRGGLGIDSMKKHEVREGFTPHPNRVRKPSTPKTRKQQLHAKAAACQPYDPELPYRYMFDPHYNKYPYGPQYDVVDGEDDGKRYLNVPAYSYPDSDSTTRVLYCDAPPKIWELCDDSY